MSTPLSQYLSEGQKGLMMEGYHLLAHAKEDVQKQSFIFNDYSFVVFPFAKAYEGFLKQMFLDAGFITERDYTSDHFRVGKVLSPNLQRRLGTRSVYRKITSSVGVELAERVWNTWKSGRNEVFHYYPHNLRSLTLAEAESMIDIIVKTMEEVVKELSVIKVKGRLAQLSTN